MPVSKAYVTAGARREDIIQRERYLIPGTGTKRWQRSADRNTEYSGYKASQVSRITIDILGSESVPLKHMSRDGCDTNSSIRGKRTGESAQKVLRSVDVVNWLLRAADTCHPSHAHVIMHFALPAIPNRHPCSRSCLYTTQETSRTRLAETADSREKKVDDA